MSKILIILNLKIIFLLWFSSKWSVSITWWSGSMMGMSEWLEGNQRTASAGTYTKGDVCALVPCPASLLCVSLDEMYIKIEEH